MQKKVNGLNPAADHRDMNDEARYHDALIRATVLEDGTWVFAPEDRAFVKAYTKRFQEEAIKAGTGYRRKDGAFVFAPPPKKRTSKARARAYARAAEILNEELGCDELRVRAYARGDTLDISTEEFEILCWGLEGLATAEEIAEAAMDEVRSTYESLE